MTTHKLFLIECDNKVTEILPEEYGKLEFLCPHWKFMRQKLAVDLVEHVGVLWHNRPAHMFVDEMGHLEGKQSPNGKATAIYYNSTITRRGGVPYGDLQEEAKPYTEFYRKYGHFIVGPALLWTGGIA